MSDLAQVIGRRWGNPMTDDALAACREDAMGTPNADQLAQDVIDLLDEVSQLRFNLTCMAEWARS